MNDPNHGDETRAELLSYLVVGQLIAHARTGQWLKTAHSVELLRIWENRNGPRFDWLDQARLSILTQEVAAGFLDSPESGDADLRMLFLSGSWHLDYQAPTVMRIFRACEATLRRK